MKKHILLLSLITVGFLLFTSQETFCQFERMEIKYSVEEVIVDNIKTYNLTISVEDRTGDLIFSLYKDTPLPQNLVDESEPLPINTYTFKNLPSGRYSVKVYENEKKGGFESIDLGNIKTK